MPITPFMKMFSQSPFKLLQKHMHVSVKAVEELTPFVAALNQGDWEKVREFKQSIIDYEHQCDELKKEIRLHLPKSLFLPVSRGDILAMISAQDDLPNQVRDIAGLMLGRQMILPVELQDLFAQLLVQTVATCEQAKNIIDELDELLECGFRGNEMHVVEKMIDELDKGEEATDDIQAALRQQLFKIENTLPPVNVMFFYKVIDAVGGLADIEHHIGGKLQVLLAR